MKPLQYAHYPVYNNTLTYDVIKAFYDDRSKRRDAVEAFIKRYNSGGSTKVDRNGIHALRFYDRADVPKDWVSRGNYYYAPTARANASDSIKEVREEMKSLYVLDSSDLREALGLDPARSSFLGSPGLQLAYFSDTCALLAIPVCNEKAIAEMREKLPEVGMELLASVAYEIINQGNTK